MGKTVGGREVEKDWGNPNKSQVREVLHVGEVRGALVLLSIAALAALVVEVVFLGTWINVAGVAIPLPWTIVVAYVMNLILTNTALLWTDNRLAALAPTITWFGGFFILLAWNSLPWGGDAVMGSWLRTIFLMAAGVFGGLWPLRHRRDDGCV